MIIMGLDLSIHSTGVCIFDTINRKTQYYIIGDKFTRKAMDHSSELMQLILYNKVNVDKSLPYHQQEIIKTNNIYNITSEISKLIDEYKPDCCSIEGIAFCANGDVVGLSGLNYMTRMILINKHIDTYIISPTQNKKYATGNGQADKELMMSAWRKLEKHIYDENSGVKYDDVADAYFLTRYTEALLKTPSKQFS